MRISGEVEAIGDDDSGDERPSPVDRSSSSDGAAPPRRPYPLWTKVDTGKQRLSPSPAHVTQGLWARLARHIVACFRQRVGSLRNLRGIVRALNAEMRLAGATPEDVRTALRIAVTEHPDLSKLDRVNVVTRRLASETLLEEMLSWLYEGEIVE